MTKDITTIKKQVRGIRDVLDGILSDLEEISPENPLKQVKRNAKSELESPYLMKILNSQKRKS